MLSFARTAALVSLFLIAGCERNAPEGQTAAATASGAGGASGASGAGGAGAAGDGGAGGGGHAGEGGGGGQDAGTDPPLATAQFSDAYKLESWGSCTRTDLTTLQNGTAHAPGIIGYAPTTSGVKYPLFVWTVGSFGDYQSPDVLVWIEEMASRGFVAVSLEYENGIPGGCGSLNGKALCAYDPSMADSAMSKLCARADVDCSRGIVTAGHSQGSQMAQVAKNFDMRIRATWAVGTTCDYIWNQVDGICNPSGTSDETCLLDVNTAIPGSRLRIINGDRDDYGDQTQYERMTGKTCPAGALDCLNANGSGWYRIASSDVEDYHGAPDPNHTGWGAEHCFWVNSIDGQWCPAPDANHPPDKNWLPPANLPWSLGPNLAWLKGFVNTPNVPQKIDSGASASHAEFVRDQKQVNGSSYTTTTSIDVSAPNAVPEAVYQSCAYTASSQSGVTYTIDNLGAGASYTVRLHFAEIFHGAANMRQFNVEINGTQLETNLDVFAAAGGGNKALVKSYTATANASGVITVELLNGAVDSAMVSGIEIF